MDKFIHKLRDGNRCQMICFPYLGGYVNSFSKLIDYINEDIEIWSYNAPGHGGSSAKPLQDIHSLINLYYKQLQSVITQPYIFFGHSMGAVVAYFLLQKLIALGNLALPVAIVLSACNSPAYFSTNDVATLPNDTFIEQLKSYNGICETVLQEQNLVNYFLPVYRADFMILKTAGMSDYIPLNIPAYYLWGDMDNIVSINEVYNWSNYFSNAINFLFIKNGTHMFIDNDAEKAANKLEIIAKAVL